MHSCMCVCARSWEGRRTTCRWAGGTRGRRARRRRTAASRRRRSTSTASSPASPRRASPCRTSSSSPAPTRWASPLHQLPRPPLQRDGHARRLPRRVARGTCPRTAGAGDDNLAPLDPTPARFDAAYYASLLRARGLLHSDQQLFAGGGLGATDGLVRFYAANPDAFRRDFAESMVRMASLSPLVGSQGEVRVNCRKVNYY